MAAREVVIIFLLAGFSLFILSEGQTGKGRWKMLRRSIGISAMHVALLPNDKIIVFDRTDFGPSNISLSLDRCRNDSDDKALPYDCTAHSVEFDPATHAVRPLTILTDTWCSSGALSTEGVLIQTGGYNDGDHAIRYFSPCSDCDWVEHKYGLAERRWYATNQILPDGRIIVMGGRKQFNYEFVPKASMSEHVVFQLPFLQETTDAAENNLYPFLHLSTDGNLFIFANTKSILLDYVNHKVIRTFPEIPGGVARNYPSSGSSVLLPLQLNPNNSDVKAEVMICGGSVPWANSLAMNGTFLPASDACGRLVITQDSPQWVMEDMPIGRVMGDMILLPTGDALIINGAAKGTAGWHLGRDPALHPVLYRTGITCDENHRFEVLNPSTVPRLYHSSAHLLADGRVLVGGSNPNIKYEFSGALFPTELSIEAFYPPYLGVEGVNNSRPRITSIEQGDELVYGHKLSVVFQVLNKGKLGGVGGSGEKVHVTIVAPSFTTHSFSMNQRVLVLAVEEMRHVSGGAHVMDVLAPSSPVLAPPGYYLLFVVHAGVPSRGRWIRIKQ